MIDKKDELILKELKKNSRNSTKNIAKSINMPRVTVHDRIQKMQERKIIKSFTIIPNYEEIGLPTKVFIFVTFEHNKNISQRELAKRISQLPGIKEVHIISGEYDFLLKVRAESFEKLGKLVIDKLRGIEGVGKTTSFACFDTIKEEI